MHLYINDELLNVKMANHQYGAEYVFQKYSKETNNLISIHLNRDISLLDKYDSHTNREGG